MANHAGIGTLVNEEFELATDSLDLFSIPSIESAQIEGKTQTYYPNGVITDSGPYEIIIPNDANKYTLLDYSRLYGECEVLKADGTALTDAEAVSVINNFPQTLFRQVELYLNNTCVNDLSTPTYPYKAYIENHLTYDADVKNTTLVAREMYIKDAVGSEGNIANALADNKSGFSIRKAKIVGKKVFFDMLLHIDFLHSKRYLIPGVEMKLRFIRNDDNFSLMSATSIAKIKMHKLELNVRQISIDPVVSAAIETKLGSTHAMYPIAHSKIKTFLLNSGTQSQHIPQIVRGRLPRNFIIGFVTSKSFDGDVTSNPFHFRHFDLNYMNIFINGEPIHPKAIQPSWTDDQFLQQYSWMLDNIGLHQNVSNGITMEEYKSNSCFFPYDMTPDLCNSYYSHGMDNGTIDISLSFKTALTQNVTVIFYATYDETVAIDKTRNVTIV